MINCVDACLPAPCGSAATKAQLKKRRRMAILPDCQPGNKAILKAPPLPLMLAGFSQVVTSVGIHCKRENGPGNHFKPCKASPPKPPSLLKNTRVHLHRIECTSCEPK